MPSGEHFGPAPCSSIRSSVAENASTLYIHYDHFLNSRHQGIPKRVVRKMIAKPDNIGIGSEESAVVRCSEDKVVFPQKDQLSDPEVGLDTGVSREAARGASSECLRHCYRPPERPRMFSRACSTSQSFSIVTGQETKLWQCFYNLNRYPLQSHGRGAWVLVHSPCILQSRTSMLGMA
jgi:hypothetical protein